MRNRLFLLIVVLVPLGLPATELFDGENLITDANDRSPLLSGYEYSEGSTARFIRQVWQHPESGMGDSFSYTIFYEGKRDIVRFREIRDLPGRTNCQDFSSVIHDDARRNGYRSLFWETRCQLESEYLQTIELVISGKENTYHLFKMWRSPAPVDDTTAWRELINATIVCDTRKKRHRCPETQGSD